MPDISPTLMFIANLIISVAAAATSYFFARREIRIQTHVDLDATPIIENGLAIKVENLSGTSIKSFRLLVKIMDEAGQNSAYGDANGPAIKPLESITLVLEEWWRSMDDIYEALVENPKYKPVTLGIRVVDKRLRESSRPKSSNEPTKMAVDIPDKWVFRLDLKVSYQPSLPNLRTLVFSKDFRIEKNGYEWKITPAI